MARQARRGLEGRGLVWRAGVWQGRLGSNNKKRKEVIIMGSKDLKGVIVPPINIQTFNITLIGDSPLVCHSFSEKSMRQMLEKQMKVATAGKREARNPWDDFVHSLYWITEKPKDRVVTEEDIANAKFGFPANGLKSAAVEACTLVANMAKTDARKAFYVKNNMVEIIGVPRIREDTVRVGRNKDADLRYRGEFTEWKMDLEIEYNAAVFTPEQIVNLFNNAGFSVGIGEYRPQKDGDWGRFHVASTEEMTNLMEG